MSLGPDQPVAPPPPTWREHLRSLGHRLETPDEIERVCREHDLPLDELDVRLNGFGWEDSWDNFTGPQAKAHHLLKGLDLGGDDAAGRQVDGAQRDQRPQPAGGCSVIRIAISQAAFDAIAETLPGNVSFENKTNAKGERYVWLEPAVVARLRALRGSGESYSDVILRVAADGVERTK